MRRLAVLTVFSAFLSACGESGGSTPLVARERGPGWRLSVSPVLVLGVADGAVEQEFDRVTDALHLPDGRVVVANDGSAELRYFAGDGRFLASAGRRGQGPGEFQSIARLWRAGGDTVVAYDPLLSRLTTFAGPGRLVGVSSLRPVTGGGPVPPELLGRFRDGTFLARALAPLPLDAPPGARRVPVAYFRVRPGDSTATLLGHFPGDESFVVREGSGVSANQPMFGRRTYVAVAGDRFYVGNSDTYQIAVHTADGGLLRSIRAAQPNAPVTRAHVERYRQGYLAQVEPESRPRLETILAQMPVPSTFPAHGRMLVDTDANLWVAEYPRPGAGWQVWNVFDARGRWLGPVEMPAQFRITAVGSGKVLGVLHGEREVEQVRAYRLMR